MSPEKRHRRGSTSTNPKGPRAPFGKKKGKVHSSEGRQVSTLGTGGPPQIQAVLLHRHLHCLLSYIPQPSGQSQVHYKPEKYSPFTFPSHEPPSQAPHTPIVRHQVVRDVALMAQGQVSTRQSLTFQSTALLCALNPSLLPVLL